MELKNLQENSEEEASRSEKEVESQSGTWAGSLEMQVSASDPSLVLLGKAPSLTGLQFPHP